MKKCILFLIATLVAPVTMTVGQNVILGEKVAEIKPSAWLNAHQTPSAPLTYIEFYQSSNKACLKSLDQLRALTDKMGSRMRVIVVAQDKAEKVGDTLTPYLSQQLSVAIDPSGKIFAAFGINYIPFGVLTDSKNRAIWLGNTLQLNEQIIEKVSR